MSDQVENAATELVQPQPNRWTLTNSQRADVIARLSDIIKKRSVTVITKDGPQESEDMADKNAIAACRVLAELESQNQRDEEHTIDMQSASTNGLPLDRPIVLMLPANSRGEMPR